MKRMEEKVVRQNRRKYSDRTITEHYSYHVLMAKTRGFVPLEKSLWVSIAIKPCKYCGGSDIKTVANWSLFRNNKNKTIADNKFELDKYNILLCGVDRIDSSVGYTVDNSVPCCKMCNMMKNKYSVDDFILHITKIYKHSANDK